MLSRTAQMESANTTASLAALPLAQACTRNRKDLDKLRPPQSTLYGGIRLKETARVPLSCGCIPELTGREVT